MNRALNTIIPLARRIFRRSSVFSEPIIDLCEITDDPITAARICGTRRFVISVPLALCRNRRGFPFTQDGPHPFVRTARAYAEGRAVSYGQSPLQQYYDHYQPRNAAEALELPGEPSSKLLAAPPYGVVLPWESRSPNDGEARCAVTANRESREHGMQLSLEHGTSGIGPVSIEKGALEFSRLARLVDGIRAHGYIRSSRPDGDIAAKPLAWGDRGIRYVLKAGKHRAAVLAALGFVRVPIRMRFTNVPAMDDLDHWPHVKDGLFSREQAFELFRRAWEGDPPPSAVPAEWCSDRPPPRPRAAVSA